MRHIQRSILFLICLTILFASFGRAQEKQSNDLFKIKVDGKYGFIDKSGKVIIEPQFQGAYDFSGSLAKVYTSGEFSTAYIDETGKIVIEPKFDIGGNFSEGFVWVGFNPQKTFSSVKVGNITINSYSSQSSHSFNYNIGFIDKTGKFITEPIFTFAGDFSEGLAFVRTKENKFGFIDKSGSVIIKTNYYLVDDFKNGLAEIQELNRNDDIVNTKYGYIDKTGKVIWQPTK